MTSSEWIGLGISYAYALGLLGVGELLSRRFGVAPDLTRKVVHIGAGMWIFGVLALFDRWQVGIIPFASFILLNYLFYRLRIFRSLGDEHSSPGTVYFAIAITLLFGVLWRPDGPLDRVAAAAAGIMAMTWGDALAALVGRFYGRRRYRIGGSTRSYEGSAAMFAASAAAMALTLLLLPASALAPFAPPVAPGGALLAALLGAAAATTAEAVSPHGIDNLSVPLIGAATVWAVMGGA
jgi:phytol kinase